MIIRNATLLDFQDLSRRSGVDLRIAEGHIVEIGRGLSAGGSARGTAQGSKPEELIDATGMYVIPGLVNLHAHTAMTLLRRIPGDLDRLDNRRTYDRWLADAAGYDQAKIEIENRTLRISDAGPPTYFRKNSRLTLINFCYNR